MHTLKEEIRKIRNITRSKERKINVYHGGLKLNAATHSRPLQTTRQGCQNTRTLHRPQHTKHPPLVKSIPRFKNLSLSDSNLQNLPPLRST